MKKSELKRKCSLQNKGTRLKQSSSLSSDPTKKLVVSTPLKAKASLKTKAVLSSKTQLKANTDLKQNRGLVSKTSLSSNTQLESHTQLKVKQKTAKKLDGEYFSIFGPIDICAITGEKRTKTGKGKWNVVPHHVFSGAYKTKSEEYGFILPLRVDWHTGHTYSIHEDAGLDLKYKRLCQEYYMNILGKTEDEFIKEFGKSYTEDK